MYRIIAHPGSAHKDDFMTVSVLLATLDNAEVLRREPTSADLDDPNTYVVDVGMEYDPARKNFDHHHNQSLPCAFHLVMKHLGLHDAAQSIFIWYPHMSMMDVRGPYNTAKHLGIDSSVLFASASPIDGYILSRFSKVTTMFREDFLYGFMRELGQDLITMIDRKMTRLELLKREARVVQVKHLKAITSSIDQSPKLSMELYLRHLNDAQIAISITPSNRGEGWELFRLNDHQSVDFLRIADNPDIRFAHANGFLAKTHTRLPLEQVIQLANLAVADQSDTVEG